MQLDKKKPSVGSIGGLNFEAVKPTNVQKSNWSFGVVK